jgi:hypothetical protein
MSSWEDTKENCLYVNSRWMAGATSFSPATVQTLSRTSFWDVILR